MCLWPCTSPASTGEPANEDRVCSRRRKWWLGLWEMVSFRLGSKVQCAFFGDSFSASRLEAIAVRLEAIHFCWGFR